MNESARILETDWSWGSYFSTRDVFNATDKGRISVMSRFQLGHEVLCRLGHEVLCRLGHDVLCRLGHDVLCWLGHDVLCRLGHEVLCAPFLTFKNLKSFSCFKILCVISVLKNLFRIIIFCQSKKLTKSNKRRIMKHNILRQDS